MLSTTPARPFGETTRSYTSNGWFSRWVFTTWSVLTILIVLSFLGGSGGLTLRPRHPYPTEGGEGCWCGGSSGALVRVVEGADQAQDEPEQHQGGEDQV